ncbi:MAG: glycosyltransferase family 2 protein [Chloroflexi bacterium]|nr:glycosyltransferase family 2 protein [Chloroflexota bacterium]
MSHHKSQLKVMAAIPAYNEEKYIGTIVLKTRQYVDEVIVVDDGSTDSTSSVASLAGATVIRHDKNMGKGAAIQSILAEARRKNPHILVLLDADFQHDPDEIPILIKPIISDGFDLAIGSREQQRGKIPRYRRIGQRVLSYFSRILSKEKVIDSECGYRALSPRAIAELKLRQKGFAIETEMIAAATEKGLKITEVPISAIYTKDSSTLNPLSHGVGVLTWILAMISQRRPLLFFGIPGVVLVAAGIYLGMWVLDVASAGGGLPAGRAMISILLVLAGVFSTFTGIILNAISQLRD